jgi:hypothetical protein
MRPARPNALNEEPLLAEFAEVADAEAEANAVLPDGDLAAEAATEAATVPLPATLAALEVAATAVVAAPAAVVAAPAAEVAAGGVAPAAALVGPAAPAEPVSVTAVLRQLESGPV